MISLNKEEHNSGTFREKMLKQTLDSHIVAGIKLDASSKRQQQEVPPC